MTPRSGTNQFAVLLIACAPIAYVLSIGPVVAAFDGKPPDFIIVFYLPVVWLHDHTFLQEPLRQYADLWGWH